MTEGLRTELQMKQAEMEQHGTQTAAERMRLLSELRAAEAAAADAEAEGGRLRRATKDAEVRGRMSY